MEAFQHWVVSYETIKYDLELDIRQFSLQAHGVRQNCTLYSMWKCADSFVLLCGCVTGLA